MWYTGPPCTVENILADFHESVSCHSVDSFSLFALSKKRKANTTDQTMTNAPPCSALRFTQEAKKIMNVRRSTHRQFVAFFGVSAAIASIAWGKMARRNLIPSKGAPRHFLWTLHWLKTYSSTDVICGMFRIGSDKTFTKWRDLFIAALKDLDFVSNFCTDHGIPTKNHSQSHLTNFFFCTSFLRLTSMTDSSATMVVSVS